VEKEGTGGAFGHWGWFKRGTAVQIHRGVTPVRVNLGEPCFSTTQWVLKKLNKGKIPNKKRNWGLGSQKKNSAYAGKRPMDLRRRDQGGEKKHKKKKGGNAANRKTVKKVKKRNLKSNGDSTKRRKKKGGHPEKKSRWRKGTRTGSEEYTKPFSCRRYFTNCKNERKGGVAKKTPRGKRNSQPSGRVRGSHQNQTKKEKGVEKKKKNFQRGFQKKNLKEIHYKKKAGRRPANWGGGGEFTATQRETHA